MKINKPKKKNESQGSNKNPSTMKADGAFVFKNEINAYIKGHQELSDEVLAEACGISVNAVDHRRRAMKLKRAEKPLKPKVEETLKERRAKLATKVASSTKEKQLKEAIAYIEELEKEKEDLFLVKKTIQTFEIQTKKVGEGKSEAVAFMVASDWHVEEPVVPAQVNDMNEYNLAISKARSEKFFQNGLRLIQIFQKDTKIKQLVMPLLGDFITNSIHEDLAESNLLLPGEAAWLAQQYLVSGIEFILKNSDLDILLVCHSGNHGRMTQKMHVSTEAGNSLEIYMYKNMAEYFSKQPRVKFLVAEGLMSYVKVYDYTIRFLHGHSIKFNGGIGGITVPVRKAISQWNKIRKADLTVFGHFHQMFDGNDFLVNGSLIGYNNFALSIKADYEKPRQGFFLISNYQGGEKTVVAPIRV